MSLLPWVYSIGDGFKDDYRGYELWIQYTSAMMVVEALADGRETIRRKFIFYTEEEALEMMKDEIDKLID